MARESYVETGLGRMRRWMALRGLTYLHLTTAQLRQVPSPLDLLDTPRGHLDG